MNPTAFLRPFAAILALLLWNGPLPARAEPAAGAGAQAELQEWGRDELSLPYSDQLKLARFAEQYPTIDLAQLKKLSKAAILPADRPRSLDWLKDSLEAITSGKLTWNVAREHAALRAEIFEWANDYQRLGLNSRDALDTADLLAPYPASELDHLKSLVEAAKRQSPSGQWRTALDGIHKTLQDTGHDRARIREAGKRAADYRDLHDWAYGSSHNLSRDQARKLADLAAKHGSIDLATAKALTNEVYRHRSGDRDAALKRIEHIFTSIEEASEPKKAAREKALTRAKAENELFEWLYSGSSLPVVQKSPALEAAELLAGLAPGKLDPLKDLARGSFHRAGGNTGSAFVTDLRAIAAEIEKKPSLLTERAANARFIQELYNWSYAGPFNLGMSDARALALGAGQIPGATLAACQRLFNAVAAGESSTSAAVREIKKELELLKADPGSLSRRIARAEFRGNLFKHFYNVVNLSSTEAAELRDFFGDFPPGDGTLDLIKRAGTLAASGYYVSNRQRTNELKEFFKDAAANPKLLSDGVSLLERRAELYRYAYSTLNLSHRESVQVIALVADFPTELLPEVKAVLHQQLTLPQQTKARSEKDLQTLFTSLPRTKEALAAAAKTLRHRRAILEWAYSSNGPNLGSIQSVEVADLLAPVATEAEFEALKPHLLQRHARARNSTAFIQDLRTLVSAPEGLVEEFSSWSWILDSAGAITGCLQKNIVRPRVTRTHPTAQCLDRLPVQYEKGGQSGCLAYSAERKLIGPVKKNLCESPLMEEYLPFVKTIAQPVAVFHYTAGGRLDYHGHVPLDAPKVKAHAEEWSQYFWEPNRHDRSENTGLYAATDPAFTFDYGAGNPVLYEVFLPGGTRTLDISDVSGSFSAKTQAYLESKGCRVSKTGLINRNAGLSKACLQELHALMRGLDVTALQYSYGETTLPDCASRPGRAFILLRIPEVKIYSNDLASLTPEAKKELGFLREFVRRHSAYATNPLFPGWSSPEIATPTEEEFTRWRGERLYGCENLRPVPVKTPPAAECPPEAATSVQRQLDRLSAPLQRQ